MPTHNINDYVESYENTGSQSDKHWKRCVCRETLTGLCKYLETCFKREAVTTSTEKQLCLPVCALH